MKNTVLVIFSVWIVFLSGCATLFSEKSDKLTIKTEPEGAEVYLRGELLGSTPLVHTFERDTFNHVTVQIKKEGYEQKDLHLGRSLDKLSLFNLGFVLTTMGASSWATDAFSGAMIEYKPKSYLVDLEPNEKTTLNKQDNQRKKRLFFSALNYESILQDIAKGNGPYLHAYYDSFGQIERYPVFLKKVEMGAEKFFAQEDGIDLFNTLEAHLR